VMLEEQLSKWMLLDLLAHLLVGARSCASM
jgi:hypothetical protein